MARLTPILAALVTMSAGIVLSGASAAALPVGPAPGLSSGPVAEPVAHRRHHRYRRTPQRVMGLVPGPDHRRRSRLRWRAR